MKRLYISVFSVVLSSAMQAQQTTSVDFKRLEAEVTVQPEKKEVKGVVKFSFEVLKPTDSIYIDARNMNIEGLSLNQKEVHYVNDGERLWLIGDFPVSEENLLEFSYSTNPNQAMYFVGWERPDNSEYSPQVWTQGQGRYTSHWLPSFDDVTEKLEFDMSFTFPEGMEIIANGRLTEVEETTDGFIRWHFDMTQPMSSYLLAVAAGDYYKNEITSASKVPITNYFYKGDEKMVEPTFRHTKKIFDFLEEEIGFPYPWQNYKQIPVRDFLYSGMENTGTTIFSDNFVVDSIGYIDRNYIMVNAHELAHQWFGNTVTAASGEHHWLQEGFATYYALLAEREVFGDDYYYWKLFEIAERLKERSDKGEGESLMNPKAGSLTFYQKGALALHILREEVGDEDFKLGIKNYLEKYKFSTATVPQFLSEIEASSGKDLSEYAGQWLKQTAFQASDALASLQKSEFINKYLEIAALKAISLNLKKEQLSRALDFPVNDYIGQEVVYQLALENPQQVLDLYRKAFETNNLFVRQAIAHSLGEIPLELKSRYEGLLKDDSYLTKEMAFYNLWLNFSQDRQTYLKQMKGEEGFGDRNIRILWLALNLATPGFEKDSKAEVYNELSGYTAPNFPFQTRRYAFEFLFQLNSFTDQNLKDVLQGTQHQTSSFRSFCRDILKRLLVNTSYRERLLALLEELPPAEKDYLKSRLQ